MSVVLGPGVLLLAAPSLVDPNFRRSVVLLCDHGAMSTMGLVLNRPLRVGVGQLFPNFAGAVPEPPESVDPSQCVFSGGPVETQRLLVLRRSPPEPDPADIEGEALFHSFMDDVGLVTDIDRVVESEEFPVLEDYRFFLGYAGWGEGQLEQELGEEAWILCPATPKLLFDTPPQDLWGAALRSLGGIYALWATMPIDPTLN